MDNPIRLHWLDPKNPRQPFPPVRLAMKDPNGLLAIGGDLSRTRLLHAYSQGIFPWFNPDEPILWWSPDPRAVLFPAQMHVSRSLRRAIQKSDYAVTLDHAFVDVLDACSAMRARSQGTWLGNDMKRAYLDLHLHGYGHSLEIWRQGRLIGGLYGVALGQVFFGESMFSRQTDASKIALYWLCQQLLHWKFNMVDCQISSPHLLSLGAQELSRETFLEQLRPAAIDAGEMGLWRMEIDAPCAAEHLPRVV